MNRRDAIARVGLLVGGTVIGAEVFLSGCARHSTEEVSSIGFSNDVVFLMDEVGEGILPTTASSPGAKAAGIGDFMKIIVTDCYEPSEQKLFMDGIDLLQNASKQKFDKTFTELSGSEKHELLVQLDREAKDYNKNKKKEEPTHFFSMIKQLTLWGYFTSETGSTKALRYMPVPGKYEGCIAYTKGDRAWSEI
ncbi:MAG: gluconate 2-dehydrogenase subunit 3 family protein [Chryseolinea sp.]